MYPTAGVVVVVVAVVVVRTSRRAAFALPSARSAHAFHDP